MWTDDRKALMRKAVRGWPEPLGERLTEGAAAAEHLSRWPLFQGAGVIGCYASLSREIDTQPVLKLILETGRTLALPKTRGRGIMDFCRVLDPAFLHPGRLTILEPEEGAQVIPPEGIDLLLIPALAVDRAGRRLGQGGGYYDRYLPKVRCPLAALVLSRQVMPCVPCGERDFLVQWIVTGDGIAKTMAQEP